MIDFRNKVYTGSQNRDSLFDCTIDDNAKGVVIFVHGYKGYKDWGAWNLVQKEFVKNNFGFVKFNMSHNGGTVDEPIDFPDLEAFGDNCYTFELQDLETIISETYRMVNSELKMDIPIFLLGHSRGGGIAILQGARDSRVKAVISLAGISDIGARFPTGEELENWKREGVRYVLNGRTHQEMPHYFSMHKDFKAHEKELDIHLACEQLEKPFLQIHGDMDQSVSISEGLNLAQWTNTRVKIIKGAEHTFGTKQPWERDELPHEMKEAVAAGIEFFNKLPF